MSSVKITTDVSDFNSFEALRSSLNRLSWWGLQFWSVRFILARIVSDSSTVAMIYLLGSNLVMMIEWMKEEYLPKNVTDYWSNNQSQAWKSKKLKNRAKKSPPELFTKYRFKTGRRSLLKIRLEVGNQVNCSRWAITHYLNFAIRVEAGVGVGFFKLSIHCFF